MTGKKRKAERNDFMLTKAPRGTNDITGEETLKWQYVEGCARDICRRFGFSEIRTPTFEHTELFLRGVGDTTDVVEKQMYTFTDKGGRSITLRPEVTASSARAFLERNLYANPMPEKLFYIQPCFRYEKPQAGRLREFHQFGIEVFGSAEPCVDAEIISLAVMFLNELGLKNLKLNINSIGCPECRKKYNELLKSYFKENYDELCETCKNRLDRNPLRILDCKSPVCSALAENAPKLIDHICSDCSQHFEKVKEYLESMGIEYEINPNIVRGLDYYTKTVFEIVSCDIGAQSTVCGGGRYDGLISELGGDQTSGIGFGLGIERLLLTMENQGIEFPKAERVKLFIATIGDKASVEAEKIIFNLRRDKVKCEKDRMGKSLKAQMKYADKIGAVYTIVLGDDEIETGVFKMKNMDTGETVEVRRENILEYLR